MSARDARPGSTTRREGWVRPTSFWHTHYVGDDGWALCGGLLIAFDAGLELAADDGKLLWGDCALCREKLDLRAGRKPHRRVA
jgi:hypothetical protein